MEENKNESLVEVEEVKTSDTIEINAKDTARANIKPVAKRASTGGLHASALSRRRISLEHPVIPEEALRGRRYILHRFIEPVTADQHVHRHPQQFTQSVKIVQRRYALALQPVIDCLLAS